MRITRRPPLRRPVINDEAGDAPEEGEKAADVIGGERQAE
jgi:hypothetical protein